MPPKQDETIDALIAEITARCDDDAAAMAAFHAAIEEKLKLPTFGLTIGERVQIDGIEYTSPRRGGVARLRKDGRTRTVSLLDVTLPGKSKLNPMDNTGARFCWQAIRQGFAWKDWDK